VTAQSNRDDEHPNIPSTLLHCLSYTADRAAERQLLAGSSKCGRSFNGVERSMVEESDERMGHLR